MNTNAVSLPSSSINSSTSARKKLTPPVAKYEPERARTHKTQSIKLHSEDQNYVEKALLRIGPTLDRICQDRHWHIDALKDRLDPEYYPTPESISRVINNTGKRRTSAGQLLELRRVSGISLDKLADGCDPYVFEQMSDARLVEMMGQISAELARRIQQQ